MLEPSKTLGVRFISFSFYIFVCFEETMLISFLSFFCEGCSFHFKYIVRQILHFWDPFIFSVQGGLSSPFPMGQLNYEKMQPGLSPSFTQSLPFRNYVLTHITLVVHQATANIISSYMMCSQLCFHQLLASVTSFLAKQ